MPVEFYLHTPLPNDQNERFAITTTARSLSNAFGHKSEHYVLVINIDPDHDPRLKEHKNTLSQLDGLLFGPNFVALLEVKRYFHIEVESLAGQPIRKWKWFAWIKKGKVEKKVEIGKGNKNPFQQVNNARAWWMDYFAELSFDLFEKRRASDLRDAWRHLKACLLFQPFLSEDSIIPRDFERDYGDWFHCGGIDNFVSLVKSLHSPRLQLAPHEIASLVSSSGLNARPWDLGEEFKNPIGILYTKERKEEAERAHIIHFHDELVIGRLAGAKSYDINLSTSSISRPHALVKVQMGEIYLVDLNSTFGTFDEEGKPIDSEGGRQLYDGDIVYLGNTDKSKACWIRFERGIPPDSTTTQPDTELPSEN